MNSILTLTEMKRWNGKLLNWQLPPQSKFSPIKIYPGSDFNYFKIVLYFSLSSRFRSSTYLNYIRDLKSF